MFLILILLITDRAFAQSYGSFEVSHDSFSQQLPVELKSNGKIYLTQISVDDSSKDLSPMSGDEIVGAFDEQHTFHKLSTLTIDQVIKMPHGSFLLPIIASSHGNISAGTLVKFVKVDVVSIESLMLRPANPARRDKIESLRDSLPRAPDRVRRDLTNTQPIAAALVNAAKEEETKNAAKVANDAKEEETKNTFTKS